MGALAGLGRRGEHNVVTAHSLLCRSVTTSFQAQAAGSPVPRNLANTALRGCRPKTVTPSAALGCGLRRRTMECFSGWASIGTICRLASED